MKTLLNPANAVDLQDSQQFEARHSHDGLLLRYCRGRQRTFWPRQVLNFIVTAVLCLMEDWRLALVVMVLVMAADALDCHVLWRVARRYQGTAIPRRVAALVAWSGFFQSAVIALCLARVWLQSPTLPMEFFLTAILTSTTINAGLIRPYQRRTANLKIAPIVGVWFLLMLHSAWNAANFTTWLHDNAYYLLATLMLGYASFHFLHYVDKTFAHNTAMQLDLLRNKHALEQSREALRDREAQARRLAIVAENANDSIVICEADGRITWVNDTFTRLTGYTADEVIGRRPADFLNAPGTEQAAIEEIHTSRSEGRPCRVELMNITKDGRHIWMDVSITPIFNPDGSHAMTIQVERDVTEAKARAEELAQANIEAREALAAKSRFLATMSHEIRTPMNGVIGMAELLSRTPLDAEQQAYLSAIVDSGDALLSVINDILDLSKMQSGKMEVMAAPFDLVASLQGVAMLLRPLATDKRIALTVDTGAFDTLWVTGDAGRVRQILLNLVGNAVKFTRDGRVCLRLTCTKTTMADVRIDVQDTGIGIAPDRIDQVFDSFTQADGAITREFGGTGLGLTISRMLARAMGGEVSAQSHLHEGSTFALHLQLPLAAAPRVTVAQPAEMTAFGDVHVLIAEDNRTNRLILRKMLQAPGLTITEAENGAEAIALYAVQVPQLVIMDMQMPIMDGLTAITHIRAHEVLHNLPRCPVIVLTANAFSEDQAASFAADADDFLTKPVVRNLLIARITTLLQAARSQAPLTPARRLA